MKRKKKEKQRMTWKQSDQPDPWPDSERALRHCLQIACNWSKNLTVTNKSLQKNSDSESPRGKGKNLK
jgi:hypothetical protein